MKLPAFILVLLFTLFSCQNKSSNQTTDSSENETENLNSSMEGTWELIGYYNYNNNEIVDSFKTNQGYRQIKMYTPTRVMWSKDVPQDSTEWFGYGQYTNNDSTLVEVLEYGSESMKEIIENKKEFKYELDLDKNKFSQIELDDEGNRIYAENYRRIE